MTKRSFLFALCLLAALAPTARAAGDPEWVRVATTNFVVYSDAGEKRARATAERLEGFRALLASLFPQAVAASHTGQVPVVAFRSDGDFKPYKPLYNGKPANVAGLFLGGEEQALMALDVSAWEGSSHVVFHEYIHRLLAGNDLPVPLWFNEGVAEFYSTASTEGTKGQVGKIVPGHLELLQERGLVPLAALFSVSHDSPDYNERNRQGVFYAESWAFVHFCILDPEQQRPRQLMDFATRQGRGEPAAAAFKAAFGVDTTEMDKALKAYIRQATVPIANLTFAAPMEVAKAAAEPAKMVEVEYYLGNVLALEQRYDDAVPHFKHAMELDASSSLPHEGLGFVALRKKDIAAAKAAFAEAAKRDSKSYLALYYFALASMGSSDQATSAASRSALERAVAINPTFAGSYELLAVLALQAGDAKTASDWAEKGLKVDPQNGRLRVNLASAEANAGRFDDARRNLKRVVDTSDDEGARSYARSLLEQLDAHADAMRAAPPPPAATVEPSGTPITDERPSLVRRSGFGDEHIRVAAGEVHGTVTRIECDQKRMTVHIAFGGREYTFTSDDPATLVIGTLNLDSLDHETIDCGATMSREAYVQFDPEVEGEMSGVLRAVIFVRPAK
jgi:tetratricopeptide (TPR) repeat protein